MSPEPTTFELSPLGGARTATTDDHRVRSANAHSAAAGSRTSCVTT